MTRKEEKEGGEGRRRWEDKNKDWSHHSRIWLDDYL